MLAWLSLAMAAARTAADVCTGRSETSTTAPPDAPLAPALHPAPCTRAPQTVTVCLYGQSTTPRLRQAGMEFAVWVFKHAAPAQLAPAAPSILDGCLQLLDDGGLACVWGLMCLSPALSVAWCLVRCWASCRPPKASAATSLTHLDPATPPPPSPPTPPHTQHLAGSTRGGDVTSLTLRGFTYQAVGQLAQRQPRAFAGRTDIAADFFTALATEQPGVRAAVQEATSSLASAFRCCCLTRCCYCLARCCCCCGDGGGCPFSFCLHTQHLPPSCSLWACACLSLCGCAGARKARLRPRCSSCCWSRCRGSSPRRCAWRRCR